MGKERWIRMASRKEPCTEQKLYGKITGYGLRTLRRCLQRGGNIPSPEPRLERKEYAPIVRLNRAARRKYAWQQPLTWNDQGIP